MVVLQVLAFVVIVGIFVTLFCLTLKHKNKVKELEDEVFDLKEQNELTRVNADLHSQIRIKQAIKDHQRAFDADNAHLLSQALLGHTTQTLYDDIAGLVSRRFDRAAQEFLGNLTDEAEGISNSLKVDITEKIWDSFQNYKQLAKDTPLLLPDNCRLAYTKGNMTVMLIEQKPQLRTITFSSGMVGATSTRHAASSTQSGHRFVLAFPYVYFLIVFSGEKYYFHEIYFRNKPLLSVREHLYLAPLPNVYRDNGSDGEMCMGDEFNRMVKAEPNIVKQCDMAISQFWQSTFSGDLGSGKRSKIDSRISTYGKWQENSTKDSLFVLSVNWPKGKTAKGIIEAKFENRIRTHELDPVERHIRDVLDAGSNKIAERVKEEIVNVKSHIPTGLMLQQQSRSLLDQVVLNHAKRVYTNLAPKPEE